MAHTSRREGTLSIGRNYFDFGNKNKVTGLKPTGGSKKDASAQIKDSCNQDHEPSAWKEHFSQ